MGADHDGQSSQTARRTVRFARIAEAIAEGERIAEWERAGVARFAGQWSAGQILNHLGAWAEFPFDGYPIRMPWWIRLLVRPMKRRIIWVGMPTGRRIPGVKGGTAETE